MGVLTRENQVVMQMTSQFLSFPSTQPLKYLVFTMSATTRSYEKSQWTRVRFPTRRDVYVVRDLNNASNRRSRAWTPSWSRCEVVTSLIQRWCLPVPVEFVAGKKNKNQKTQKEKEKEELRREKNKKEK